MPGHTLVVVGYSVEDDGDFLVWIVPQFLNALKNVLAADKESLRFGYQGRAGDVEIVQWRKRLRDGTLDDRVPLPDDDRQQGGIGLGDGGLVDGIVNFLEDQLSFF